VIPCFNVARHIRDVITSLPPFVDVIVAVNDASSDETDEILSGIDDERLIVLTHSTNGGVGAAVCSGYEAAGQSGAEIIVKMDGDGQMDPKQLPRLIRPLLLGEADYSKGNRFIDVEDLKSMPKTRLLGNAILSFFTKVVSGYWSIFDPTNGYTAIRLPVLERLNLKRLSRRYFFETSMLIELAIEKAHVRDIEMPARYADEQSHIRIMHVGVQFPGQLVRGLLRRFYWRYLVFDFSPGTLGVIFGFPLLIFGIVFGALNWWSSVSTGIPATAGTALLAALPIILGFQLLLMSLILDMQAQPKSPLCEPIMNAEQVDSFLQTGE
jgi:glycosyltransferase involved in cell wall biosynthesis